MQLHGKKLTEEFTPLALNGIQKLWVKEGHARQTINRWTLAIKQMFNWGVTYGYVSTNTHYKLSQVPNLKEGHTAAPEYDEVKPVDPEVVARTIPFMPPVIADMVRVQLLGGFRAQDVRNMRICDIDRREKIWRYTPFEHKTKHKGKLRLLAVGPRAQKILTTYLIQKQDKPTVFLFSPRDSVEIQREEKRRNRKTKVQPSQINRKKENPKRQPAEQYTKESYARAVARACRKAGTQATITGLTKDTKYEFRHRALLDDGSSNWSESVFVVTNREETFNTRKLTFKNISKTTDSATFTWPYVKEASYEVQYRPVGETTWTTVSIEKFPEWSPGQLRHTAGSAIRDKYGLDGAQVCLAHASAKTSEIYAVLNFEKAARIMADMG